MIVIDFFGGIVEFRVFYFFWFLFLFLCIFIFSMKYIYILGGVFVYQVEMSLLVSVMVVLRNVFFYYVRFLYLQVYFCNNIYDKDEVNESEELKYVNGINLFIYLEIDKFGEGRYKMKEGWYLYLYILQLLCEFYLYFLSFV